MNIFYFKDMGSFFRNDFVLRGCYYYGFLCFIVLGNVVSIRDREGSFKLMIGIVFLFLNKSIFGFSGSKGNYRVKLFFGLVNLMGSF